MTKVTNSHYNAESPREESNRSWWRIYTATRIVDLLIAALLVILVVPVMLVIAAAIKVESSGPILFRQIRLGYKDRPFPVYKFRTMRFDAGLTSAMSQSARSDPRVTRIGALLRRTSLDELPQLINVLRGDMALVGPRPQLITDAEFLRRMRPGKVLTPSKVEEWWSARKNVPPGLINPSKVLGHRTQTGTEEALERILSVEMEYIQHRTVLGDLGWVAAAAASIFRSEGAY